MIHSIYILYCDEGKQCIVKTMYEKKKIEIIQSHLPKNVFRPKQHVYVNVFRETHNNV